MKNTKYKIIYDSSEGMFYMYIYGVKLKNRQKIYDEIEKEGNVFDKLKDRGIFVIPVFE